MKRERMVGVDIGKYRFDAEWCDGEETYTAHFENDAAGHERLLAWLPARAHIVMEATGTYFLSLATYLYHHRRRVSVVNPAQPVYYARMKLLRAKTDPVDARVLRQYGEAEAASLVAWQPREVLFTELNQLDKHLQGLQKDINQVGNRLEALNQCVTVDAWTKQDLEAQYGDLAGRIERCETELVRRVREQYPELLALLTSIPGIGDKTAVMFIVLTEAFTRFSGAKSFAAYVGLTSFLKRSGTSVKCNGGITKMGQGRMRQLLYMAAGSARQHNLSCRTFAERLKSNGKPPKVVRVAVANKLIRQAFAVLEKREAYSEAYA